MHTTKNQNHVHTTIIYGVGTGAWGVEGVVSSVLTNVGRTAKVASRSLHARKNQKQVRKKNHEKKLHTIRESNLCTSVMAGERTLATGPRCRKRNSPCKKNENDGLGIEPTSLAAANGRLTTGRGTKSLNTGAVSKDKVP